MTSVFRLSLIALVGSIAIAVLPSVQAQSGSTADSLAQFPRVEGTNLEGRHFVLPSDLGGSLNVVLVAFKREQQNDVDTWTPFLKATLATRPGLRTYELPVLGRRYRLMRPFIDGGMRRGIPDAAVRAATITLYIDKSPFRDALHLPDEDRIYVLLVDHQGRVQWRGDGTFTERAGADLVRRMDAIAPSHVDH